MRRHQSGDVRALDSQTLTTTAMCSLYHGYGRRTGLKIRSSRGGVGSRPTFGTIVRARSKRPKLPGGARPLEPDRDPNSVCCPPNAGDRRREFGMVSLEPRRAMRILDVIECMADRQSLSAVS
jgi:hypothetical protein